MIEKFEDYLGTLPLTSVIRTRIEEVIKLNSKIIEDEIQDIMICEHKDGEGARTYTSLWLFTDKYCTECKYFLTSNDFDVTPYENSIDYCSIVPINYDFETFNSGSTINVHFHFGTGISGNIIATEENCNKAFEIYKKYIVANLAT